MEVCTHGIDEVIKDEQSWIRNCLTEYQIAATGLWQWWFYCLDTRYATLPRCYCMTIFHHNHNSSPPPNFVFFVFLLLFFSPTSTIKAWTSHREGLSRIRMLWNLPMKCMLLHIHERSLLRHDIWTILMIIGFSMIPYTISSPKDLRARQSSITYAIHFQPY